MDVFDAVFCFADLFRVAIFLAASSVRICMDVQTLYVLACGRTFANESSRTCRKSAQQGSGVIQWRRSSGADFEAARLRPFGSAQGRLSRDSRECPEQSRRAAVSPCADLVH